MVRVSFKVTHFCPILRIVEFLEAVFTKVTRAPGCKVIIACHPGGPKYLTDIALSHPLPLLVYQLGVVSQMLAVGGVQHPVQGEISLFKECL